MPEAVYKDTPNNRKLGRVGEKFGDPKFKTTKKAPASAPAPKKAAAPKKAPAPKKSNKNILNDEIIELFIQFFEVAKEFDSNINYNFDNIDEPSWTKLEPFVFDFSQEDPSNEETYDPDLGPYYKDLRKNKKKIETILRGKWDKGLKFSDFGLKDQEEFNKAVFYDSGGIYGSDPAPSPAPAPAPAPAPPIVMPYAHINPAVDFMISQKGPGSMPIKNFGSAVKPDPKPISIEGKQYKLSKGNKKSGLKEEVNKLKSMVEIQKQKDKDKLKNFKQYQDYVQLF